MLNKKIKWLQLSQRQRMSPFPNYMSMESICREMKKVVGYAYEQVVIIFQENMFYVYMDKNDHKRVGMGVLKKVFKHPDLFVRMKKTQEGYARRFYAFLKANNKPAQLAKIGDGKLASLHEEYDRRYKQIYSHYFPILAIEIYFFKYLRDYVNGREKDPRKATRYVDTLITERRAMVNRQEAIAAFHACQRISRNLRWLKYFKKKSIKDVIASIEKDKKLSSIIKKHERNWFWITRDYEDPVLTLEDFVKRFKKHLAGNPARALKKLQDEELQLQKNIARISTVLNMDKKHQRLFQTMREGIWYKELRKGIVSQTLYYYDPVLQEIARRGGLSLRQARHLLTHEVRPMLVKGVDMTHELNDRIKLSVYHCIKGNARVYTGKKAKKYYNYFVKVDKNAKVFYGMPVSPGVARGPVKIAINPDAFHKIKKGDIISTIQATPVFTHVLSIASALACDGGPGITSHPATLSREAGIPGVIGLRMGTKVFKDGQIIEVDGDKGIVKIVK